MAQHRDWTRAPLRFATALIVALTATLFAISGCFRPVEDALTSYRAQLLNRAPSGETAIIEIDARSLAQLHSWPWPRQYHGQLVKQLHRAGASIIAFDVDFSARSATGDQSFGSAIRDAGNVILPIFA